MSVIVIAETPGLDAGRYQRIVTEQGHRVDKLPAGCGSLRGTGQRGLPGCRRLDSAEQAAQSGRTVLAPAMQRAGFAPSRPQVFPLHYALTRSEA